ncbi:MAG: hypothetical protein ACJ72K_06565 [Friedmanniella sp.]|jgi:hypothetical protein
MLFFLAALLRPVRRTSRRELQAISGSGNTGWKAEGYGTFPKRGDRGSRSAHAGAGEAEPARPVQTQLTGGSVSL